MWSNNNLPPNQQLNDFSNSTPDPVENNLPYGMPTPSGDMSPPFYFGVISPLTTQEYRQEYGVAPAQNIYSYQGFNVQDFSSLDQGYQPISNPNGLGLTSHPSQSLNAPNNEIPLRIEEQVLLQSNDTKKSTSDWDIIKHQMPLAMADKELEIDAIRAKNRKASQRYRLKQKVTKEKAEELEKENEQLKKEIEQLKKGPAYQTVLELQAKVAQLEEENEKLKKLVNDQALRSEGAVQLQAENAQNMVETYKAFKALFEVNFNLVSKTQEKVPVEEKTEERNEARKKVHGSKRSRSIFQQVAISDDDKQINNNSNNSNNNGKRR